MTRNFTWRKSSYSGATDGSNCVEVAFAQVVRIRDSKNTAGPELGFSAEAWQAFVSSEATAQR